MNSILSLNTFLLDFSLIDCKSSFYKRFGMYGLKLIDFRKSNIPRKEN